MKQITSVCLWILILGSCQAQDMPAKVKTAFIEKFPTAKDAVWEKDDDEYEVEFKVAGIEINAAFTTDGLWLETEWKFNEKEIPDDINSDIKKRFSGYIIDEVKIVEIPEMKGYELVLENEYNKEIEIMYTLGGAFFKKVIDDDDDKE